MELNSLTNVFTGGMDMDTDVAMLSEGKYRYAENVRIITDAQGTTGALQNIEYVRKYTIGVPADEIILGTSNTLLYDSEAKRTYEVGIVVTKKTVNDLIYNTVYVVKGFDSIDVETLPIVRGYLEIESNVNIVCNYESANVSNIYITDGNTPIKVINIEEQLRTITSSGVPEVSDPTRFDITPGSVLMPFHFESKINGVLPAGAVQYAYQLFNMHGGETPVSALSEVIPIVNLSSDSKSVKGGIKKDITDMGCQIKASFMNDGRFDRMRIYAIVYLDNVTVPNIYIANEVKIPNSTEYEFIECTYTDSGNGYLSQITIDEFNAMTPYEFTATSIEKLLNRLFAANVQEITWDVTFDARAYRCDQYGIVRLNSGSGDYIHGVLNPDGNIYDLTGTTKLIIPEEHDCVNPSNVNLTTNDNTYTYGVSLSGSVFRGGSGPNVSYKFVYTPITLSDAGTSDTTVSANVNFNCSTYKSVILFYYEDGTVCRAESIANGAVIPNYSDPFMCANYLGYQRDEIYRFGIIFYNNKGIPSPVHWIGDIKMPATYYTTDTSSKIYPFHFKDDGYELTAYALGLEFTVKNIPDEAYAYEIVRCDRTAADRTVICQGGLGATIHYDYDTTISYGSSDTRFLTSLMLPEGNVYMHGRWNGKDRWTKQSVQPDCFEFASPEMCISGDSTINMVTNGYLQPLYYATSFAYDSNVNNINTIASIPKKVTHVTGEVIDNFYYAYDGLTIRMGDESYPYYSLGFDDDDGNYHERCAVFKHYALTTYNNLTTASLSKITNAMITKMLPYQRKYEELRNYVQPFEDYSIINASFHFGSIFPNHGISGVLRVEDFDSFIPISSLTSTSALPYYNEFNTCAICNVKKNILPYGGNSYVNRQVNVYQSCGCFASRDKEAEPIICYGGDTYLCVFDYLNTVMVQHSNDYEDEGRMRVCHVSYLPVETTINLNYRIFDSFNTTANSTLCDNLIQVEPISTSYKVQDEPLYGYNSVYSTQSGSKQYIPRGLYDEDNMMNNCRIVSSELKTNNEITDSWTKFKVANYIDIDTKYGPITNLKAFKNKLYFWQNAAVGIAAVNERSLITDSNMAELTLGTGGILTRFDYVAEQNGSSIINDKSIVTSENYIYWYDFDKNVICQLGSGLLPLSKALNVQTYLNSLHSDAKTNAVSFYDHKYNEVWFRLYDKALIYNERLNIFTSFYTHNPNWFFPFSDKLVTIKDNNMYYLHNIYDINSEDLEERVSKIQFVVNKEITHTKVFDNVVFNADLIDNNNTIPNIIKDVVFKTRTQETNPIDFNNIEIREENYRFPISREKVEDNELSQLVSQSYLGRMRGKYLICDYTFDCNDNREFKLPYIKTTYRYSML